MKNRSFTGFSLAKTEPLASEQFSGNIDAQDRLIDNQIDDEQSKKIVDEFTYESAGSICKRLDISTNTFLKLAAQYELKRYRLGKTRLVRYKVLDVIRLLGA